MIELTKYFFVLFNLFSFSFSFKQTSKTLPILLFTSDTTKALQKIRNQKICLKNSFLTETTLTIAKSWSDEDLPNILGINPIEAAILFGLLYYYYGPDTLYDYARQAGKLFSTYAPIVKDVSLDIFNELRDYLEENREREILRKSGVNVDDMPRRTSNVIERFQQSLSVYYF
jgi:hypothetical protein